MWYGVAMDTGLVAQYNESRARYWSFYRAASPSKLLDSGRGWWAEVSVREGKAEWLPWA